MKLPILLALALVGTACESIAPDHDDDGEESMAADGTASDGETGDGDGAVDPSVAHELEIEATNAKEWVYVDLERGKVVNVADPATSQAWDLAFKRFSIAMNGGVSGAGGVEAAVVPGAFDALTDAPAEGYRSDVADDDSDDDLDPQWVLSTGDTGWWDYDETTHILTPRAHVYAVRTVEKAIFKLEVLGYYNASGSSGYPRIQFQQLVAGEGPMEEPDAGVVEEPDAGAEAGADASVEDNYATLDVNASSTTEWVYLSVAHGLVSVTDATTSLDWDIAFQRTLIRTNSGTSGPGMAGARLLEGDDFASLEVSPYDDGFTADAVIAIPGSTGSTDVSANAVLADWYDYDVTTHIVTPKDQAYIVRRADGSYGKFRITAWNSGSYSVDVGTLSAPSAP